MSFGFNFSGGSQVSGIGGMFSRLREKQAAQAPAAPAPVAANPQREGAMQHVAQREAQFSDQANPAGGFADRAAGIQARVRNNIASKPSHGGGGDCA